MKKFFEKIKNWLKTEKVVKRSTLILLCLSVFACGILYTFIISRNSCTSNNESETANVRLASISSNGNTEYIGEMDDLHYVDVDEEEMEMPFDIDFNIDKYTQVMTYGFRPILRPEITQGQLNNIKNTIRDYAYDYYDYYDNLLYLSNGTYGVHNTNNLPSGLAIEFRNGYIHINGSTDELAVLRIDISEIFNNAFINLNSNMFLFTKIVSGKVSNYLNSVDYFYVGLRDANKEWLRTTKTFFNGRSFSREPYFMDAMPKYLEIRLYKGVYNDLTFITQLEKNENRSTSVVGNWFEINSSMKNRIHVSEKPYDVMCMYNNCVYSFNECFNSMDVYQNKLEEQVYNTRETLVDMLSSVVSAPINFMKDTLNFSLFGFNLFNILASIITLILTAFVIKKLL